jgi:hypothetical protein
MVSVVVTETLELNRITVEADDAVTSVTVTDATDYDRVAVAQSGEAITVQLSTTAAGVTSVNGLTGVVTLTTGNINEGTNLYYTSSRANSDFDSRLATKTTTNLAEGSNLYYTTARANSDFDTRLATKSTSNIAEGSNLYYTTARSNTDFDSRLATKTTSNLTEGTNKYYTDARVGTYLTTNNYATESYVSTAISNLVDSAPTTLNTLNELAAALGDDPNFATTVTTSLGNKLNTADFNSTFDTRLATKTTDNLTEGSTNLYYSDSYVDQWLNAGNNSVQLGQTSIAGTLTVNPVAAQAFFYIPVTYFGDTGLGGEQGIQINTSAGIGFIVLGADGRLHWNSSGIDASVTDRFDLPLTVNKTATASTTSTTSIDTWSSLRYRAAKYLITAKNSTNYSVTELLVLNTGTGVDHIEYSVLNSNASLATYSLSLAANTVTLSATAVNNNTEFKFTRTMVEL